MTSRPEWVDPYRVLGVAVEETPTLENFAYGDTNALLGVEPRLVALARLVERAQLGADDDLWSGVEQLAAVLLGPTRSATQLTPVNSVSIAVSGTWSGATTQARFVAALRGASEGAP